MEQGFEHKQAVSGANILNHYMVLPLRKRPDCSSDLACVRAPFCRCGFRYPHYFDHPLLDEFQFLFIIHKPTELPPKKSSSPNCLCSILHHECVPLNYLLSQPHRLLSFNRFANNEVTDPVDLCY